MKTLLKILKTNWIHLPGFYVSTYFATIVFQILGVYRYHGYSWPRTLLMNLVSIPFLFFTYGLMFLVSFYLLILLIDFIAFRYTKLEVIHIMFVEWIIIIPPFVYWAFKEEYWLWLVLVISFLCTQLIRTKWIRTIRQP